MAGRARRRTPHAPPDAAAAMEIAARYLATRPRSRWEVERRLRRAGADDAVVSETLERLATLGLVDDAVFVRWWAEQRDRHAPRGRRLLEAELRQRGVAREHLALLSALGTEHDEEQRQGLPGTELERAVTALDRHLRGRPLPDEPAARRRIGTYLVRRGFDSQTAREAIRRAGANDEALDENDG